MCRMFGMAARAAVCSSVWLTEAPRSLRALSAEHPDGWGIAMHDGAWRVARGTTCAAASPAYVAAAADRARIAVAHVRKKTVGDTALANTHPFRRGDFVFAHNGTVTAVPALVARTAPAHAAAIEGDTDSERLFAFLCTQIDDAGDVERGVHAAVRALRALGDIGTASFLFATGSQLFAHRAGRSLFTLARADATMIASEPLGDEPWSELPEGALVVLETRSVHALAA